MPDDSAIGHETDAAQGSGWSGKNRRDLDRRRQPTRPWARFLGPLRRAHGRRTDDRRNYVDVYTPKDVALLLTIFLLNVADAFFTLLWLSRGGREANPAMDFLLEIGTGAFIVQKCFIVGLWLVFLLVHKNHRLARVGLYTAFAVYAVLIILHFSIIALDITPPNQRRVEGSVANTRIPLQIRAIEGTRLVLGAEEGPVGRSDGFVSSERVVRPEAERQARPEADARPD